MVAEKKVDESDLELAIYGALNHRFPYFFIIINPELGLDYVSAGTESMIGLTAQQLMARTVDQLVHPDDLHSAIPMALEMMSTGVESIDNPSAAHTVEIPIRIMTSGDGWCPMVLSGRVLDESGRILCVLRPNAERHALDAVLRMLSLGTEYGADLTSILDAVLDLLLAQFSAPAAGVVNADGRLVTSRGTGFRVIGSHIEQTMVQWETAMYVDADGTEFWGLDIIGDLSGVDYGSLLMVAPRTGGPSPYDSLVMRRTADLARLAFARSSFDRMLSDAANTDHLTGVLNRRAVENQLRNIEEDGELPVTVLFIDLDDFKGINDQWGHQVGDEVLRRVARRISSSLRDDDVLGRLGGDEFIVLCRTLDPHMGAQLRERIVTSLRDPIEVNDVLIPISASVGSACANNRDEVADVLHRSDLDMYRRKSARGVRSLVGQP